MLKLIIKDILIQKKVLFLGFLYIIFMVFFFQNQNSDSMFPTGLMAFTYIMAQTACAYDEKNKTDILLVSLPIKRYKIVLSRYISVFVFALIGFFEYSILYLITNGLNLPLTVKPVTLAGFAGTVFALSLIHGLYFPLFFRLGYVKTKFFNMLIFFFIFAAIGSASYIIKNTVNALFVEKILGGPELLLGIGAIFVSLAMLSISYCLSVRFYKKRDF
jgi:ABC-2 type transport system permease protein